MLEILENRVNNEQFSIFFSPKNNIFHFVWNLEERKGKKIAKVRKSRALYHWNIIFIEKSVWENIFFVSQNFPCLYSVSFFSLYFMNTTIILSLITFSDSSRVNQVKIWMICLIKKTEILSFDGPQTDLIGTWKWKLSLKQIRWLCKILNADLLRRLNQTAIYAFALNLFFNLHQIYFSLPVNLSILWICLGLQEYEI